MVRALSTTLMDRGTKDLFIMAWRMVKVNTIIKMDSILLETGLAIKKKGLEFISMGKQKDMKDNLKITWSTAKVKLYNKMGTFTLEIFMKTKKIKKANILMQ